MATDFTRDSVLHFLKSNGGSVRNSDLLLHFSCFLRGEEDQARHRELFKKFVNSVATVKQVDGVSYVVLRRKFRGHVSGGGGDLSGAHGKKSELPKGAENPRPVEREEKPRGQAVTEPGEVTSSAPQGPSTRTNILPAAGIIVNNNNNVETRFNLIPEKQDWVTATQQQQQQQEQQQQQQGDYAPPPGMKPAGGAYGEATHQPITETQTVKEAPRKTVGLSNQELIGEAPPLHHSNLNTEDVLRRARHRKSYKTAVSCDDDEEDDEEGDVPRRPGSVGGAWAQTTLGSTGKSISASSPCVTDPAPPLYVISSSSSNSSGRKHELPQIFIEDVEEETLSPRGLWSEAGASPGGKWAGPQIDVGSAPVPRDSMLIRRSLPLEAMHYTPSPDRAEERVEHHLYDIHSNPQYSQCDPPTIQFESEIWPSHSPRTWPSSSQSVFSPLSDAGVSSSDWPPSGSPRGSGWNSSNEELHTRQDDTGSGAKVQDLLMGTKAAKVQSVMYPEDSKTTASWLHSHLHDSQENIARLSPWRYSTGDVIGDSEEVGSSEGSTSSSHLSLHPAIARRLSSNLRSRMCRSLGENLDQPFPEEVRGGGGSEAARQNRLQLISSSLSLRHNLSSSSLSSCSTPPRCHSMADLNEGEEEGRGGKRTSGKRSLPITLSSSARSQQDANRQSLVPLEPREHAWLVKGAAGSWTDIYSLFREDPSLLNRHDFISGFTVLHWIAKHGDHRVLNTLWYGVEKAGVNLDVNARSVCGHTPLHVSAIHSHKNMMRLLVHKFDADIELRDTAGKKAWQYLNPSMTSEFFQLLGAPPRATVAAHRPEEGDRNWQKQHHHRQRRRHHHSSASSGERQLTVAGTTRVKRSSSLAAFLKHKSLRHFHGHQSDSSV